MIDRYAREAMKDIWSDDGKYDRWLAVEIAACEAWTRMGTIPEEDMAAHPQGDVGPRQAR